MTINEVLYKSFSKGDIVDSKLGDVAAQVAVQNFDYRFVTLVFFNSTLYYGVELFLNAFHYNIIVHKGNFDPNLTKITQQYVIFDNDVLGFQLLLDNIEELAIKKSGKFIIVCQSQVSNDCDENELTRLFWEFNIVDVVIIKTEEKEALGYTYYPFSKGKCNNVIPIKLKSSNHSQYITTSHGKVFGMKLKKLNFCPLIVSTFIQTPYMKIINGTPLGADGDLLRIIAYGLNTSLKMMTPRRGNGWGFRHENGTWSGSLADIYDDLANLSMTSSLLTIPRFSDFQISHSYFIKNAGWITHPATFQNQAFRLLHPFGPTTRMALVITYILVILVAFVFKTKKWSSICRRIHVIQSSRSIVFYSWMICMGQSLIKLPTRSSFFQITFTWIYFCFLMRTAYQVFLISSLKENILEGQFETIEDAIRANYPFGGAVSLKSYFDDYPAVYDNWVIIDTPDIIPTILNISKGQKFVLGVNMDTAKLLIKTYKLNLHILPQKIVSSPTVIFLKKHSPFTEALNLVLDQLIETGFPEKTVKDYTNVKTAEIYKDQEPLKLIHLTACFLVLITGWILSFIFFLLEMYFGKIYKHPMLLS